MAVAAVVSPPSITKLVTSNAIAVERIADTLIKVAPTSNALASLSECFSQFLEDKMFEHFFNPPLKLNAGIKYYIPICKGD